MVKPSGWHTVKYNDIIDGNYLYNRCHLIGFQLAGENANPKNLITGTRYLNVVGMLSFENTSFTGRDSLFFAWCSPVFMIVLNSLFEKSSLAKGVVDFSLRSEGIFTVSVVVLH